MGRFQVIEGCNGYYLYDTITGREACMGYGVDQFTCPECGNTGYVVDGQGPDAITELCGCGGIFVPGTPEFLEMWQAEVNEHEAEYFEAYFYDLWALQTYRALRAKNTYAISLGPDRGIGLWLAGSGKWHNSGVVRTMAAHADRPDMFESVAFLDLPTEVQAEIAKALEEA